MRKASNFVGGMGSSSTGNIGDILTKIGNGSDEYDWVPFIDLIGGAVSNGTTSITIPVANEDLIHNVGVGFVHRFKLANVDVATLSATAFSLETILSTVNGEQSATLSTVRGTHVSYDGAVQELSVNRAFSTSYDFLKCVSSAGTIPDIKMKIDGEGRIHTDQPVLVSGADYAEMFEWGDSNIYDEDRVGCTVVLSECGKVRVATESDINDTILGVVSANPTMVGNASPLGWDRKYLRDDFGRITGPNPDFDPEQEYTPRAYRKEYAVVGVIGQIPIRNGQVVKNSWIPMFKVSDSVTMYWVR